MNYRTFILQGVYSSGGVPMQIISSDPNVVRVIDGNRLVPVGIGTVTLTLEVPGNEQFIPAQPVQRQISVVSPSKQAWRQFRRGDVRYEGTQERFVWRLLGRDPNLNLLDAQKIFD